MGICWVRVGNGRRGAWLWEAEWGRGEGEGENEESCCGEGAGAFWGGRGRGGYSSGNRGQEGSVVVLLSYLEDRIWGGAVEIVTTAELVSRLVSQHTKALFNNCTQRSFISRRAPAP